MDSLCYEQSIVVNYSKRLAWEKYGKESKDNLIHMFIYGVP